jgi:MoaA/NifB/PqqE/SkfB family radical SAM enzyme
MSKSKDLFFYKIKSKLIHKLHPLETFFIEIDSACNLTCKHCYIPKIHKNKYLELKDIERILQLVHQEFGSTPGIAITGGEPLLHPQFKEIASLLNRYSYTWSLATNATMISKTTPLNGCAAITISIDGKIDDHNLIRGSNSNYHKVIENIRLIINKDIPNIYLTSTIHDGNIQSLKDIGEIVGGFNGRVKWKINTLLDCENSRSNNLRISESTYLKIIEFADKYDGEIILGEKNPLSLKHKEYFFSEFDQCAAGVTTFGVLSNGDIVNCMVCRENPLGNISNISSIKEIWEAEDTSEKGLCEKHIENRKV